MEETDRVLLVERALPVRPDWTTSGALFALVADHINLTSDNPLVGPNADEWGPRFPDLTDAWDPTLRRVLRESALEAGVELREGVVAGVTGESRTAAELGMLRMVGADMASRGFVHEAIVARHAGRRVAGLAVLSVGTPLPDEAATVSTMVRAAVRALDGAGEMPDPDTAGADV
jgi:purine nucleoside phosphorylase